MKAYGSYARAADLDPSNVDAQIQAGTLLLIGGEFDKARTRADWRSRPTPRRAPANILLGNAMAGMNETGSAIKQIEQAISLDRSYAPARTALGAVQFLGGRREGAGSAFRKAVDFAPRSIDARLALANYQRASGDTAAAEATLRKALAVDGASAAIHRTLALLYVTTRRAAEAEPHFKALTSEPAGQLALADYYTGMGKRELSVSVLHEIERGTDQSDARAARLRLSSFKYAAGNKAEAYRFLDGILREKPKHDEAHVAKARMLLNDGKTDEAAAQAAEAVKANAGSVGAQYTLGLTALARDDAAAAERAFQEVLTLNPRAAAARLQLARLQLARGETAGALSAAEEVARERPDDVEAAVLMARSLRAQGDVSRAECELAGRIARRPDVAPLRTEMGWIALQRRQVASARASLRRRSASSRTCTTRGSGSSRRTWRVATSAEPGPISAAGSRSRRATCACRSCRRAWASGEARGGGGVAAAGRRVGDASQLEAYDLLGRIHMSQGQVDRALVEYRALADRSKSPIGPLTMIGMIEESTGKKEAARQTSSAVLKANPRAGRGQQPRVDVCGPGEAG